MTFDEVLGQGLALLRGRGRVSYRALKRQFALDDAYLADLTAEIIDVHQLAVEQDGTMLVWTGAATASLTPPATSPQSTPHRAPPVVRLPLTLGRLERARKESGRGDFLTEAYRGKGELLLQSGALRPGSAGGTPQAALGRPQAAEAEACFQQALTIARRQQAKSWELRAATGLSRLWQQQSKQAAARALLAPTCDWFTEGFDTADLQEAQALLEELE